MSPRAPRIAYWYREMSEYIEIDLRLLRERHDLEVTGCPSRWPRPVETWRTVGRSDAVMSWFASAHALLPALFARLRGRPFVIVVGGYDTACLPGIDYGHQRGGVRAAIARVVLALATRVVAISPFTLREVAALGVPAGRTAMIPLGLDPARYACDAAREPDLVITTGGVNRSNLSRKGLEPFVRAAALRPDLRFVVVGAWMDDAIDHLRSFATPNVTFTGRVSHEEKVRWMTRASCVVQASRHEAFGLSLAESMLCGAVPVVTGAGALPWVAGGTGEVIPDATPAAIAAGLDAARARGDAGHRSARAHVLGQFTIARRREALERLLDEALGARPAGHPASHVREAA